jgi:hypothetical protein
MNDSGKSSSFALSTGGLFHRLMLLVRLVEANRDHPGRRIAVFIGITWLPLLILTAIDNTLTGAGIKITFLHDPVPHVRYLIAMPLLVIAERVIDPYLHAILQHFGTSGLVSDDAKPLYDKALQRLNRLKDAMWVDVALFLFAFSLGWIFEFASGLSTMDQESSSWMLTVAGEAKDLTPAGWWFLLISIPLLQFFVYRWIWRLIIWIGFMNQISRIRLVLQPAHPDRSGGLGILSRGQVSFGVVFAALGAMKSSTLAHEIMYEGRAISDIQWEVIGHVLICFLIITGPLCTFFSNLLSTKREGLRTYGTLGYRLTETFHKKWIKNLSKDKGGGLITAIDPSAMADYTAVYETVSGIKLIPLNRSSVIWLVLILVGPFIPLVFTQFSVKEAFQQLIQTFV